MISAFLSPVAIPIFQPQLFLSLTGELQALPALSRAVFGDAQCCGQLLPTPPSP